MKCNFKQYVEEKHEAENNNINIIEVYEIEHPT
jgi:hypothetical protein